MEWELQITKNVARLLGSQSLIFLQKGQDCTLDDFPPLFNLYRN